MYSKESQLKKVKAKKDLTEAEKTKYFTWIKQNKECIVCGKFPEIHHITNKSIRGPRRLHSRVIPLCFNHHSNQSEYYSVHRFQDEFYKKHGGLESIIEKSEEMYQEYLSV